MNYRMQKNMALQMRNFFSFKKEFIAGERCKVFFLYLFKKIQYFWLCWWIHQEFLSMFNNTCVVIFTSFCKTHVGALLLINNLCEDYVRMWVINPSCKHTENFRNYDSSIVSMSHAWWNEMSVDFILTYKLQFILYLHLYRIIIHNWFILITIFECT